MAGSLKTANYELSKYAPNDFTSYLVDFNGNMDKIDAQMKANSDANVGTAGTVSALAQRVTANETKISNLENKIEVDSNNITELTQKVTANETKISELDGKVTASENDINSIETKLTDILKVQTFTGPKTTIGAGASEAVSIDVTAPAGYSTVGVVGFYLGALKLTAIRVAKNRIDVENIGGDQVTFTPTLTVLFVKQGSI